MWRKKYFDIETQLQNMHNLENKVTLITTENERLTQRLKDKSQQTEEWKDKYFTL